MELAPRDIVARSIQSEIDQGRGLEGGYVHLDLRHLGREKILKRLPGIRQICVDFGGLDPSEEPIPVQPGQHYSMGGIDTDVTGRTAVPNLYAAGECACVSVHGANRLGGNSLLETVVFGRLVAEAINARRDDAAFRLSESVVEAHRCALTDKVGRLVGRAGGVPHYRIRERLRALLKLQDEQDPSLAFRYACRGAVCGSCAMSINGKLDLACRVLLENLQTERVIVEPLPRFDILKDLVVDMDPFWEKYERVQPWLHAESVPADEIRMSERERDKIDPYVNCILCGLCCAACPVVSSRPDFTGPAALAKLYRFLSDSRERRDRTTLEQEDTDIGAWGCHTITRCIAVCPKSVRPTDGITGLRRRLLVHRLEGLFGREPNED